MHSWTDPAPPRIRPHDDRLELFDTSTGTTRHPGNDADSASLYVCGITPYDATHLGHANTYVAFDLLHRYWLAAGLEVAYTQNVTDVDDPLLERADASGVAWDDLAREQTDLFRTDMQALNVLAPHHYLSVSETVPAIVAAVEALVERGLGYRVPGGDGEPDGDVYFDTRAAERQTPWRLGAIGAHDEDEMRRFFAERGGDPDRAGKRDPFDPLLWRAARDGEPSWDGGTLGAGRPGWHVECSVIARSTLPAPFTVQAGGSDLRFPHHEFSAAHATGLDDAPLALTYTHSGMVGLDGQKMSKSLGNLELVSRLRAAGVDPVAIRAGLLDHHYRSDWDWSAQVLERAQARVAAWRQALAAERPEDAESLRRQIVEALSRDLDAPAALAALDRWADQAQARTAQQGHAEGSGPGTDALPAGADAAGVTEVVDALLGLRLR
ncbi:L-cysteine:1D-myo-inositol 2-amino-2-deoxy-alpha-D-glucopyranoside ligase [Micrococcus cohnii]|uniref:L-cysteine:1D-myo-inositol 2-amino-2-deoxy-alpha-D-glucopyranoside ligase n=1 Tax=Micrococcus cohnii TaxID=993416 RepID=A0A7W7GNB3_9MICC|nr:cysteine--1-D-myo-inosityl 2-amino-2-deoxy-alpha-D-glucopyranoside ligase [Micrococcus cohnii]MBB4735247.1 L-cysteine:1D-myo-inositol 2-amino-2-deoxy-alpha-D-glucopyranoside ligase [Micrococcus cohnii]